MPGPPKKRRQRPAGRSGPRRAASIVAMSIFFMILVQGPGLYQARPDPELHRLVSSAPHIFRWQPYPLRYAFEYRRDTSRIQRPTNLVSAYLPTIRGTPCSCSSGRCVMFKMAREIEYRSSKAIACYQAPLFRISGPLTIELARKMPIL